MSIPAIILAAGASRRLGQPKQLIGFGGEPLLERALRVAFEAGASPVVAVLGANFAAICRSISFDSAIPVLNDRWELGLSTSIQTGLDEAEVRAPWSAGVLFIPCDQPHLTADHLRALLAGFEARNSVSIVASAYAGTRGIPAVFPRTFYPQLYSLRGDRGAGAILRTPDYPVIEVAFDGGEVDIDLPRDLTALERL